MKNTIKKNTMRSMVFFFMVTRTRIELVLPP